MTITIAGEPEMLAAVNTYLHPEKTLKRMRMIVMGELAHDQLRAGHNRIPGGKVTRQLCTLMDDLHGIYRVDPYTENGLGVLPMISTLNREHGSAYHIYASDDMVVDGFYLSLCSESANDASIMTFVWVVPKFRGGGVFTKMYTDLVADSPGGVIVDRPNKACMSALAKIWGKLEMPT